MKTALWDTTVEEHRETDFTDHKDWCIEAVREPNSQELWLAKYSRADARLTFAKTFEIDGLTFHPPTENELSRHVRLPSSYALAAPPVGPLLDELDSFLGRCLDLDERYRFLLSCFVLSTWTVDRLPVAPYIALVGLPRSGKSTALRALYLLCRRALITSDISSAAFYRLCDRWMPTLCIDEAATAGQQRTLFHLLRSGTTRDAVAFREKQSYRTFGAKVVVWNQMPDDEALNSRCIVIPMQETSRTDLERTTKPDVIEAANYISAELATFRNANYQKLHLPHIAGAERLRSRDRDLYEALALPIGEDPQACAHLLECLEYQRDLNREPLAARELAVLESSFKVIHAEPNQETYSFRQLKDESNKWLAGSGERFRVNEKGVSSALKTFGFVNRRRTRAGWVVIVDQTARNRLHELLLLHGVSSLSECLPFEQPGEQCEFCHALEKELTATASVRDRAIVGGNDSAGQSGSTRREHSERRERKIQVGGNDRLSGGLQVATSEQVASQPATERALPTGSSPDDRERREHGERKMQTDGNSPWSGPGSSETGNGQAPKRMQDATASGSGHHGRADVSSAEQVASQPGTEHATPTESAAASDSERYGGEDDIRHNSNSTPQAATESADTNGQEHEQPVPIQGASTTSDAAAAQEPTPGLTGGEPPAALEPQMRAGSQDGIQPLEKINKVISRSAQPDQAVEVSGDVPSSPEDLQDTLAKVYEKSLRRQRKRDKKPATDEKRDPDEENG